MEAASAISGADSHFPFNLNEHVLAIGKRDLKLIVPVVIKILPFDVEMWRFLIQPTIIIIHARNCFDGD